MRRGTWAENPARLRAASTDGVISARELERLGVPERTTYRRCQEDGPWRWLLPGIILLAGGEPTRQQLEVAALLHAGENSVLTGLTGARHHRLRRGDDPAAVHVLVSWTRQVRSFGFVVVERTRRLPRPLLRDTLPVAPVARCVLDETRRMRDLSAIASILAEPVQRRMVLPETLLAELDAGCRKGSAAPRRVLASVIDGIRSAAEFDCRAWWLSHPELPSARWNMRVCDEEGRLVGIADAVVEDVGFVWQIDSVEQHFATPEQVAATAAAHRAYRSVGLHVLGTRPTQCRDDSGGVLRDVLDGLDTARRLPPPRVVYRPDLPRSA